MKKVLDKVKEQQIPPEEEHVSLLAPEGYTFEDYIRDAPKIVKALDKLNSSSGLPELDDAFKKAFKRKPKDDK
jgi:hypothetical protein